MADKPSNVDQWLERGTPRIRKALESASRYFDSNDELTVNTLEAVYGQENSFGILLGKRGSTDAAGHFQFEPKTAAARYLKDLHTWFGKRTTLSEGLHTVPVTNISERKKFVLGAFNAGEGRIAGAQRLAERAGKNPQSWSDVATYLPQETQQYVEVLPLYEAEFARKSPADKSRKRKSARKGKYRCTVGHWRTIDDRPVFICA